jgi:hypothetical protein
VFANHGLTIASFLMNNFRTPGGFLCLNPPPLRASVKESHFGKISFVLVRVLSSLTWIFSCNRVEVWKFGPDMSHTLRYDRQHKDAAAIDPGQMGLAGRAMRRTLQINLRSILDQSEPRDVSDSLNEAPVRVSQAIRVLAVVAPPVCASVCF